MSKRNKKILTILLVIVVCVLTGMAVYNVIRNVGGDKDDITVYFVRHARTDANDAGILAGCETDAKITDEGSKLAKKTGEYLSDVKFDTVYTSTLSRTKDTASIILDANKNSTPAISQLAILSDVNWGRAAGLTPYEAGQKYPDFSEDNYLGTIDNNNFESPIGATSKYTKVKNFENVLEQVIATTPSGGNALVVGHSSFVWLLQSMFPNQVNASDALSNTSVTVLKYNDGRWTLDQLNYNP